jgi:hypothetical protein
MYGLVNKAIKDLVLNNHGVVKWSEICKLSDFPEGDFAGMNSYPDKLTYDLMKNALLVVKIGEENNSQTVMLQIKKI